MNQKEYKALVEVRSLIARGHIQGMNHLTLSDGDYYCLVGAVNAVTRTSQVNTSYYRKHKNSIFSRTDWKTRYQILCELESRVGYVESFNDNTDRNTILGVLDKMIAECEPKNMEIGKPEKQIIAEPAEQIPGIKESPAPAPEPVKEPVAPEREKVPA